MCFLMLVSTCFCVPLYLRLNASLSLASKDLVLLPVLLFAEDSLSLRD